MFFLVINNEVTMKKTYLALAFLITGFLLAGDAYGEENEIFYCADIVGAGFTGAVLHFAFPYLEKHRLVVQDLIA